VTTVPSARVILDSSSPTGDRLTTLEVVMHRFVLAEFNTHRAFSRNSASSRAIPVAKQLERVRTDPAIPLSFPAEQKGMQGGKELAGQRRENAVESWLEARDYAVESAEHLLGDAVHKSVVNRLLEPFMWHTVIVTATDWDGFWRQRCSELAQPEIRVAAEAMRAVYAASTPGPVPAYGWHLPYLTDEDLKTAFRLGIDPRGVSAARCARVSVLTHDGRRDLVADEGLYRRLCEADPPHASPLEHVATPGEGLGNFRGWRQLRHEVLDY